MLKGNSGEVFEPPKNEGEQKPEQEKPAESQPLKTAAEVATGEKKPEKPAEAGLEPKAEELSDEQKEKKLEKSPEATEVKKEIDAMPREEKMGLWRGIKSAGFYAMKGKSSFFAGTFEKLGGKSDSQKTLSRFMSGLAETYRRDEKSADKKLEDARKGKTHIWISSGSLFGNLIKYGRIVGDVASWTASMPLRYAMLGSAGFARISESAKEARFKNEELMDKTRIQDADQASEEAWKIYEKAKEKNGGQPVKSEDLQKAYNKELPADLLERLQKPSLTEKVGMANRVVQNVAKWNIERSAEKIQKKLDEIQFNKDLSKSQKAAGQKKIMDKYERRLKDWDRAVTQYGTVDALAMGARYAELAGKTAVIAMTAETLASGIEHIPKVIHNIANLLSKSDLSHVVETTAIGHITGNPEIHPDISAMHGTAPHEFATAQADRLAQPMLGHRPMPAYLSSTTPHEAAMGMTPHEAAPEIPRGAPVPVPEAFVNPEYSAVIPKNGSTWEAAKSIGLNDKEFAAAWSNPESVVHTAQGVVHISEANVVHPGDIANYIPGKNGGVGHFDIFPASGQHIGTGAVLEHVAPLKPLDMSAPQGPSPLTQEAFGNPPPAGHENVMGYPDHPPVIPTHPDHPPGNPVWEFNNQPTTPEHAAIPPHPEATQAFVHPPETPKSMPNIDQAIHNVEINSAVENVPMHTNDMIGDAHIGYDSAGQLTLDTGNVTLFNEQSAYENLSKNYAAALKELTANNHMDFQNAVDNVKSSARQIFKAIHIYGNLRGNTSTKPEMLTALKEMITNEIGRMTKIYGPDIIDKSKLAEFLK